jgi:serine protease Do
MHRVVMIASLLLAPSVLYGQDRDAKVRQDRQAFQTSRDWIYNDLDEGIKVAKASNRPLFVVFRCIPCEACQEFDDDVARRDPIIRDLLDKFVCVRVVQANRMDLTRFQFDFDQSFAVFLMNADLTIYGRFATRSEREESDDISLKGLRKAMEAALRIHGDYNRVKPSLAGKQVRPGRYNTPRDFPSLAGKYQETLNYEGQVAKSCIHCHQIGEAIRNVYLAETKPVRNEVLFPYPDPAVLGLTMDPEECALVRKVRDDSAAKSAGVQDGDELLLLAGQPLLSTADIQWVLHNTPENAEIPVEVRRQGKQIPLKLLLSEGWRRGDISWRATTWDLRRLALGGLRLDDLSNAERIEAKLSPNEMALRVRHAGEFGEHAIAKRGGVEKRDIIVAFDGLNGRMSESSLIAEIVGRRRPSYEVTVVVLRNGERKTLKYKLP